MLRVLSSVLAVVAGVFIGGKVGVAMSYWFAPEIMRLYLGWGDYLAVLPKFLHPDNPLALAPLVITCHLLGAVGGAFLALGAFRYLTHRNN